MIETKSGESDLAMTFLFIHYLISQGLMVIVLMMVFIVVTTAVVYWMFNTLIDIFTDTEETTS